LNPKILRLLGIFPTFGVDAQVNWTNFVAILAMFLLRKEVLELRFQLILNFLQLKDSYEPLKRRDYIQYEFQKYKFSNRTSAVVITTELQQFWDKFRTALLNKKEWVFQIGSNDQLDIDFACKALIEGDVNHDDTMVFFDFLFEIE